MCAGYSEEATYFKRAKLNTPGPRLIHAPLKCPNEQQCAQILGCTPYGDIWRDRTYVHSLVWPFARAFSNTDELQ
jgi:hypothetical protein